MKRILSLIVINLFLFFSSCSKDDSISSSESSSDFASESPSGGGGDQGQAGLITAGEWNDLSEWGFWKNLLNTKDYSKMSSYWNVYTNNRISIVVEDGNTPVINAKVELLRNDSVIWNARTDNSGYAELWIGMFQKEEIRDLSNISIKVNNELLNQNLVLIENEINSIKINSDTKDSNKVELSFIVDATGSMGDELEFLKEDLKSVISRVKQDDSNLDIYTSTVFYRDQGDDYVTKTSEFTNDLNTTIGFINQQSAEGGGDFPEAVHTAFDLAINEFQWSDIAKTRIAFLVLDAPPHYEAGVIESINNTIKVAAKKGIKVIPITASGIDKETEFLMRFLAISTNGSYVFITNDSGIGNDHLEPSVGQYEVELLNDLMVRLIKKYSK